MTDSTTFLVGYSTALLFITVKLFLTFMTFSLDLCVNIFFECPRPWSLVVVSGGLCADTPVLALYDPFGVDVPLNLDITHSLTLCCRTHH